MARFELHRHRNDIPAAPLPLCSGLMCDTATTMPNVKRAFILLSLATVITTSYFSLRLGFGNHLVQTTNITDPVNRNFNAYEDETMETMMPFIHGTEITMEEILEKIDRRRRVSVKKNKNCEAVHENPTTFWRSVTKGNRTHEQDMVRMNLAAECGALNYTEMINFNPRDPPFTWEQDYFSQPALRNIQETLHPELCSVLLLNSSTQFYVGQTVAFKIVLKMRNGDQRKLGGDDVRLWLFSPNKGASIAADVFDNTNGSYLAVSRLPWSGKIKVRATVAHSRELFRTALFIQRVFKASHGFTGIFANEQASESTPCLPFPALPGFSAHEMCNLTIYNGGYPWYCGRPVKRLLNCSDVKSFRKLNWPFNTPLTEAEENIVLQTESQRPFLIPCNTTLTVVPNSAGQEFIESPVKMCNQKQLSLTFNETNQSGYFLESIWRPFDCQMPTVDKPFLLKCLKNTQMIIAGDSNSRFQMDILKNITNCTNKIIRTKVVWHSPLQCDHDSVGMSIKYYPPKNPFYGSMFEDIKNKDLFSAVDLLDNIPSTGNYLVHLHDFLHMIPSHLVLLEQRLLRLRAAITRLLARNPKVHIVYQSVHSAFDRSKFNKHKLNVFLLRLQRSILRGLGERVTFAQTWPMTVAVQNDDGHPKISNHFLALYMGHVCGRW